MAYSATLHFGAINQYAYPIATETVRFAKIVYSHTTQKVVAFLEATYHFATLGAQMILRRVEFFVVELITRNNVDVAITKELNSTNGEKFREHYHLKKRAPHPKSELNDRVGVNFLAVLPSEINAKIFSLLPASDVCSMERVSKQSKEIAKDNFIWKEIFKKEFGEKKADGKENWKKLYKFYSTPDQRRPVDKIIILCSAPKLAFRLPFSCTTTVGQMKVTFCDHTNINRSYTKYIKFFSYDQEDLSDDLEVYEVLNKLYEDDKPNTSFRMIFTLPKPQ